MTSTKTASKPAKAVLPGEDGPLEMRFGGEPITDAEVLGVSRRLARMQAAQGRTLNNLSLPETLPSPDAPMVQSAHRMPPLLIMRTRAKAEMEGRTVTSVIREALEAYTASSPGARVTYVTPAPRD